MQLASIFFVIGVALSALGVNIEMVIIGRVFLGLGVGFANQVSWNYMMFFSSKNVFP